MDTGSVYLQKPLHPHKLRDVFHLDHPVDTFLKKMGADTFGSVEEFEAAVQDIVRSVNVTISDSGRLSQEMQFEVASDIWKEEEEGNIVVYVDGEAFLINTGWRVWFLIYAITLNRGLPPWIVFLEKDNTILHAMDILKLKEGDRLQSTKLPDGRRDIILIAEEGNIPVETHVTLRDLPPYSTILDLRNHFNKFVEDNDLPAYLGEPTFKTARALKVIPMDVILPHRRRVILLMENDFPTAPPLPPLEAYTPVVWHHPKKNKKLYEEFSK